MGCRVVPYWLGTFVFDYIVYTILMSIFIILCYAFQYSFVTNYMGQILTLLMAFGFSYISFSYMFGFAY